MQTVKKNLQTEPLSAADIRAELARRKMSKRQLSDETGISYQYLVELLNGYFKATEMRRKITIHLFPQGAPRHEKVI